MITPRDLSRSAPRLLIALVVISPLVPGQFAPSPESVPSKPQNRLPRPSGMATGGMHAPIKDSHARPITAGGFVDDAPIVFVTAFALFVEPSQSNQPQVLDPILPKREC